MKKKFEKNTTQPIFSIKKPKLVYDVEKNKANETKLIKKANKFRVVKNVNYKRNFHGVQKKKAVQKKIKSNFLRETFVKNPYVHLKKEKEFQEETRLTEQKNDNEEGILKEKNFTSQKLVDLEEKLRMEINRNIGPYYSKKSKIQKEHEKLHGTKGLFKFDCWGEDLDPQDWIDVCKQNPTEPHAKCPYYQNGQYEWVDVKVLDYDKETKRFKVDVLGAKKKFIKYVSRLSLYFLKEDYENFKERVMRCKFYQQRAENRILFIKYIESIDDNLVSPMPNTKVNQILRRVLGTKQNSPDYYFEQGIVSQVIKIIRAEYLREMKKCYVLEEMKNPNKKQFFEDKKISIIQQSKKRTHYEIIINSEQHVQKKFSSKLESLKQKLFCRNQHMQSAMKLFQDKCFTHKKTVLLNLNLLEKKLPFNLDQFISNQSEYFKKNKESLKTQWKEYPLGDICDILRKIQAFSSSFNDIEEYRASGKKSLQRLIFRIDLTFRKHLRDFLDYNIAEWLDFLKQFVLPDGNQSWSIQETAFVKIELKFKDDSSHERKKKKSKISREKEKKNLIYFEPSQKQVFEKLIQPIHWLLKFVNSMKKLEADIVKVLGIPPKSIFQLTEEYEVVKKCYETIQKYLDRAFEEPNIVLARFKEFSFLLENSKEEIVKTYADKMKKKSGVAELEEYLQKIIKSISDLNQLYCDNQSFTFFEILTKKLKDYLISKAIDIKVGFLGNVSIKVNKSIKAIKNKYELMIEQLEQQPQNENELIVLNKHIKDNDDELEKQENEIDNTYQYILLMEKYGKKMHNDHLIAYWLLKVFPLKVQTAFKSAKNNSLEKEQIFVYQLENEKKLFKNRIGDYKSIFEQIKKFKDFGKIDDHFTQSSDLHQKLQKSVEDKQNYNRREEIFEIPLSQYENLDKLIEEFKPYHEMWKQGRQFDIDQEKWKTEPIKNLKYTTIESDLEKLSKKIRKTLTRKFEEEGNTNALDVCKQILEKIQEFRKDLPLIEYLSKDCMVKKSSNWKGLFNGLGIRDAATQINTASLQSLCQKNIQEYMEHIIGFVNEAELQYNLEIKLNKEIIEKLENMSLELMEHSQSGSFLLTGIDEIQQMLDEFLNSVIMMKQSKHIKNLKTKVETIERKLMGMQDLFEEWITCQRSWLYLKPIFVPEDLKKKMPNEKNAFDEVDKIWMETMKFVHLNPKIFDNFDWEKTKTDFKNCNKTLDQVQKSLSNYLEAKRGEFPRFYFLSDDELIEIISQTKDPTLVIKYLSKCFEGINSIKFKGNGHIVEIISAQKEKIQLIQPVKVNEGDKKGNVEKWLSELEKITYMTMKKRTIECFKDTETPRLKWLKSWPGQLILAINSIRWTKSVETAIYDGTLVNFKRQMKQELEDVVDLVRKPLSSLERKTLSALIVIDVHSAYVMDDLILKEVSSLEQFEWISQLRYYMIQKKGQDVVQVKIMTSDYFYQYEYLGNSSRLVITPLTDRCYRTLMNAYQNFYGGAPEGPAGTGKTETVKDLAKTVAVQCNVFNCTDQINYVAMSKFFNGLSQTGSWCCFDEFNRILPEVLSVIAVQVRTIQNAIKEQRTEFYFEGKNIKLVPSCAINITMNPGYAGRSDLPDNLKALFRPCAMMVPDYSLIAEICLYSYGFQDANSLSKKVVMALKLSSEQLSAQKHYDFGMRALKAILVAGGNLKRKNPKTNEAKLFLQALQNVNLPKFTMDDIPLFNSIITDLFPGISPPKKDWGVIKSKMLEAAEQNKIIGHPLFLSKAIEIYEMILVRHGLMVVGETFSGKTNCLNLLEYGLSQTDLPVQKRHINPKAVTGLQLYGFLDPDTKVWTEGVIPQVMKECERDAEKEEYKWVIFDGPVDAEWIENMNTVLDDNKVLCLTNGQKIKLTQWMTMMFEVEDLNSASPATVSRCGMIFIEPRQLGWKTLVEQFEKYKLSPKMNKFSKTIVFNLKWLISTCLAYVNKNFKLPLETNDLKITENCLTVFKLIMKDYEEIHGFERFPKDFENKLSDLCLFAIIWGFGGIIDEKQRSEMNIFILKSIYFEDVQESFELQIDMENWEPRGLSVQITGDKDIFSLKLDIDKMNWVDWLPKGDLDMNAFKSLRFEELIIPTGDSERNSFFISKIINNGGHIMLTGPTGTGKTIGVISEIDKNYSSQTIGSLKTSFSGQTLVNSVQYQIESKMSSRKGKKGFWGPEENKQKMVIFIDDVNMPAKETYGAQPPIELLRMWMDFKFWYDLESKEEKYFIDMQFISTMGPPSSGRNKVTSRFLRHYFLLYVTPFDNDSMNKIYDSIIEWHFVRVSPKFLPSIIALKTPLVKATLHLYAKVKSSTDLLPTPSKSHYIFSMRDITRVFETISRSTYKSFKRDQDFVKLWAHENMRVFMDRLISESDREVFMTLLKNTIKLNFPKYEWKKMVKQEPLLWADFVPISVKDKSGKTKEVSGIYVELVDKQFLKQFFEKFLQDYNSQQGKERLNLVLFIEIIEHVTRIIRVIQNSGGHSLLVGLGGLGRQTAATLAAFISDFSLKTIEVTTDYTHKKWQEDVSEILRHSGALDNQTVFLFKDTQVFQDLILEEISSLLQQGMIPGFIPVDLEAEILEDLVATYVDDELENYSKKQKFEFFKNKCKQNLSLCLCFSPVSASFRQRLRTFPSFINNTTIDWFLEWPRNALIEVAKHKLKEDLSDENLEKVSKVSVQMHISMKALAEKFYSELRRHYYVTPANYLESLKMFIKVFKNRQTTLQSDIENYQKGVQTLEESRLQVEEKKREIIELEPKLKVATIETNELIKKVEIEQKEADTKKLNCEKESVICNKNREDAQNLQKYCQEELDKVEPLLVKAAKNLKSIQRAHIDFLKQIKNPLVPIKRLYKGLCILYKLKNIPMVKDPNNTYGKKIPDYATPTRNIIMAKPDQMLNHLMSYNAETVNKMNPSIIKGLKDLQKDKDFDLEKITKVSQAAGKIAGFLLTVIEIYDKLQIINPKRENLKQAQEDLLKAEKKLKEKQDELDEVMKKIDELNKNLNSAKKKSDTLASEISRCKRQSQAAEKLVSGLDSEKVSWTRNIEILKKDEETILGDSIMSASMMSYFGVFPKNYRDQSFKHWKRFLHEIKIKLKEDFDLKEIMSNEIEIGNWTNKYKLPNDSFSIENAIYLKNSNRFSIMIDPQNQANRWIKEMEKENQLLILKPTMNFKIIQNNIEMAIENGRPVLFENIDEKPSNDMVNVFRNQIRSIGGKKRFYYNNAWKSYDDNFRFYSTTKLSKPHYSSDICVMVTMLNFQVTPLGLEDQMLNILVAKEDPSSEKMRVNNIKEFYELKKKQKITEEIILKSLTQKGDVELLDNEELIKTLQKSKQDAKDATERLRDIEIMKKKLQNTRNFYSKAANRASNMFFCVTDLENVEPMYQFSLDWFIDLYKKSLISENKDKNTRVQEIMDKFMLMLFQGIQPSLFEKDKLLFSFLLYSKTLQCENIVTISSLRELFVGCKKTIPSSDNIFENVLTKLQWSQLEELSASNKEFEDLLENFKENHDSWIEYFEKQDLDKEPLPSKYVEISDISHLMLMRIIRPNKVVPLIQKKIENVLGRTFVEFPSFNIENIYPETECSTPIIFVLSSGAEPLADIDRLSQILGKGKNIDVLSLGQGQEENAKKAIEFASMKGKWVVLQNCHLAPKFLLGVEKLLEDIKNQEFRLWLTSMPTNTFPVTLLQKGIKITSEPPRGLKANILKNFNTYSHKLVENHPKSSEWKKLLFGLTFFHSVIQERRKFASLGWNIPYEFSQMDLTISIQQTRNMLKEFDLIPWQTLLYSIAEANYGGRVTDPMDRRLIKVILNGFFGEHCFDESYKYSESGIYYCPEEMDLQNYKKFIKESFPLNDQPEIFGLHQNAEIRSGIQETNNLMVTLLSLLPRSSSKEGESIDSILKRQAQEILNQIPLQFKLVPIMKKFPIEYINSMNIVLVQEIIGYNTLINKIKTSLTKLIKAIEGFVIMTEELDEVYSKMMNNQVPDSWHKYAYPSVKPLGAWIINFLKRIEFMEKWVTEGQPISYWISGFFFTQSFLTGQLQNYSRKNKIPIDELDFEFIVLEENLNLDKAPEVGSYIHGIFIEGARWDYEKKVLVNSQPKILFTDMPHIWIFPIKSVNIEEKHVYSCPLYKTSVRAGILSTTGHSTNFVISMKIPMSEEDQEEYWIKRGVAMLCELDN